VRHIAIGGDLGSGKSTVARLLRVEMGFPIVSTGDLHRSIARSLSLSTLETNLLAENDSTIDDEVDGETLRLAAAARSAIIFDSRIAWHLVPSAYRVRLLVDPKVAAERIFARPGDAVEAYRTVDEAEQRIVARYESEKRRFQNLYGVDVSELRNFDLVVDTSDARPEWVVQEIAERYRSEQGKGTVVLASPHRVTSDGSNPVENSSSIRVLYERPHFLALGGARLLAAARDGGLPLVEVDLQFGG